MNTIKNTLSSVGEPLRLARQLLRYSGLFLWALLSPKAVLTASRVPDDGNPWLDAGRDTRPGARTPG